MDTLFNVILRLKELGNKILSKSARNIVQSYCFLKSMPMLLKCYNHFDAVKQFKRQPKVYRKSKQIAVSYDLTLIIASVTVS